MGENLGGWMEDFGCVRILVVYCGDLEGGEK